MAHASYPEVWERFLTETRDPYEITERHAEDYARRPDYVEAYRHRYAFHPIHGILATHPLKRLRHVGRVIVAAPLDPHVPRHLGFEVADSVEDAVAMARRIHGRAATIACIERARRGASPPFRTSPQEEAAPAEPALERHFRALGARRWSGAGLYRR